MELQSRIRRLEDIHEVQQLCSRYSLAVDDHDFVALREIFAKDATYGWHGRDPDAIGRDAVIDLLRSRLGPAGPSFHVNHDHLLTWDDNRADEAAGIVFAHAEGSPGGKQFLNAIRYHDRYVREEGAWRIASRNLAFLYITRPEDYAGVLLNKARLRHVDPPIPGHWPAFDA
jgi:hypothetical protein